VDAAARHNSIMTRHQVFATCAISQTSTKKKDGNKRSVEVKKKDSGRFDSDAARSHLAVSPPRGRWQKNEDRSELKS